MAYRKLHKEIEIQKEITLLFIYKAYIRIM